MKVTKDTEELSLIQGYEVAVLSNPYVGYLPDIESMRSTFISDRFFHVRNYDGVTYVVNYKLNFTSLFSKVSDSLALIPRLK